ncbi:diguanylate cyclase, partial [Candidatus Woesearchaeota archaeon]|nr:diguanylate cyclase [Candidatus Woesearchaeota archaeon]
GEEFVAVFVGATPEQAKTAAERVCSNIERLVIPAPSTAKMRRQYGPLGLPVGKITASVGISGALPDSPMSAKELIEQADGAVYTAKDMGRNRIVVYNPMTMKPRVREE